jgi:CRISPR system Cascade subunit CasB
VASVLEPAGVIASGGARRDLDEQRWSLVLKCLALLGPLHRPGQQAGTALAEAGYSELRFTRLLRARADGLLDAVEGVARYLAAKGTPVDASDLLWLMVSEDTDAEESVRRRFARSYYAALSQR